MRPIKFRQWISGKKRMEYGAGIVKDGNWKGFTSVSFDVDPIMQFAGLRDKNGTEIYEGDICKFIILGDEEKFNPLFVLTVLIVYRNASFGFIHTHPDTVVEDDRPWRAFWQSEDGEMWDEKFFTVIGNIYENQELSGGLVEECQKETT